MSNEQIPIINEQLAMSNGEEAMSGNNALRDLRLRMNNGGIVEPDFYHVIPELEADTGEGPEDMPYSLWLSPALKRCGLRAVKVVYRAGYSCGDPYGVPSDLASACLELAAWNYGRYKGRRIGLTGTVRGNGRDGEHYEIAIPENVRLLIEPYKRILI
jgi:hypothetical protein